MREGKPRSVVSLVMTGTRPCAVCGEEIGQRALDQGEAIGVIDRQLTIAHVRHFFDEENRETPDYAENLERLMVAHASAEGWIVRGEG